MSTAVVSHFCFFFTFSLSILYLALDHATCAIIMSWLLGTILYTLYRFINIILSIITLVFVYLEGVVYNYIHFTQYTSQITAILLWVVSGIKLEVPPLCGGVYSGVVSGLDFTGIVHNYFNSSLHLMSAS